MLRADTFDLMHQGLSRNIHINSVEIRKNVVIWLLER